MGACRLRKSPTGVPIACRSGDRSSNLRLLVLDRPLDSRNWRLPFPDKRRRVQLRSCANQDAYPRILRSRGPPALQRPAPAIRYPVSVCTNQTLVPREDKCVHGNEGPVWVALRRRRGHSPCPRFPLAMSEEPMRRKARFPAVGPIECFRRETPGPDECRCVSRSTRIWPCVLNALRRASSRGAPREAALRAYRGLSDTSSC